MWSRPAPGGIEIVFDPFEESEPLHTLVHAQNLCDRFDAMAAMMPWRSLAS
jgi:hypothetical protein